jgi:uncharacterized membrane protein
MNGRINTGMALDKLLIGIIGVSVFATAIWNYQVRQQAIWTDPSGDNRAEERIKNALEDIKYHLVLAGYEYDHRNQNVRVESGESSDLLKIRHNEISVEYRIDDTGNLVRTVESKEKTLAENVESLRIIRMARNSLMITLSRAPYRQNNEDEFETLSKSYSTVVRMNSLL